MTSSHHGPYDQGNTRATMGYTEGSEQVTVSESQKVASNRKSECCGEYVPGPCTHRPSHHGSGLHQK